MQDQLCYQCGCLADNCTAEVWHKRELARLLCWRCWAARASKKRIAKRFQQWLGMASDVKKETS